MLLEISTLSCKKFIFSKRTYLDQNCLPSDDAHFDDKLRKWRTNSGSDATDFRKRRFLAYTRENTNATIARSHCTFSDDGLVTKNLADSIFTLWHTVFSHLIFIIGLVSSKGQRIVFVLIWMHCSFIQWIGISIGKDCPACSCFKSSPMFDWI
jgi:hypothetical protein